jgi:hypothetical protein
MSIRRAGENLKSLPRVFNALSAASARISIDSSSGELYLILKLGVRQVLKSLNCQGYFREISFFVRVYPWI